MEGLRDGMVELGSENKGRSGTRRATVVEGMVILQRGYQQAKGWRMKKTKWNKKKT
jgi:hypothetical protein